MCALEAEDLPSRRKPILTKWLPLGTLKRKIAFWGVLPLLVLLAIAGLFDQVVMPIVTRQGSEFELPDFTNQKVVEIDTRLDDLKLSYEIAAEEFAPGKEKGLIIRQYPIAGTRVKPGRTVKFIISKGQKIVSIPQVSGKSVRQAVLDLETAGLATGEISWAFNDTIPEKVVVFSYPAAGTEVPLGSAVNLMVNRGRATDFTFMPKVIGMPLEDARKLIEQKSLKVGKLKYKTDENFLPETVLEQSEIEGAELQIGTEIDLVVSKT
jgi:eukaryotic-like serine/threonine-protein kinase